MSKSKIFYNHKTVDFHTFVDLVAVFSPKRLTDNYNEYRKILMEYYQTNDDVLNIVELVRNIEVDDGFLEDYTYNSISAVLYYNGTVKYVACY